MTAVNENMEVDEVCIDDSQDIFDLVNNNDHEAIKLAVETGIRVDIERKAGITPIHLASMNDDTVDCLIELLKAEYIDINQQSCFGLTAVAHSCQTGSHEALKILIEHGADIHFRSVTNLTPLHFACWNGSLENVKLLIEYGADVNAKDISDWTPLHEATLFGRLEICEYLLQHGASAEVRNRGGKFALNIAREKEFWGVFSVLEKRMGPRARLLYYKSVYEKIKAQNVMQPN